MIYEDYNKLCRIGMKYYKDANFCTVTALAVAAGVGFGKAFHTYKRLGRVTGRGTRLQMQKEAFRALGLKLECLPTEFKTVNQAELGLSATRGTYLVYSTGHVSCVKDGKMYDWAAGGSRKRVQLLFAVLPITN